MRWLGVAAVSALGVAGSQASLPPEFQTADAQAQTTPAAKPEVKPDAPPGEAKPEVPKSAKPRPQTATEADEALAKLMASRKPVRAATARGQTAAEAPEFKVTPRMDRIRNYPCTKCHDNKFVDRRVRELQDEHTKLVFEHGGGRFWCYDACHKGTDMDSLISLRGRTVSYDESYKLCGQCHYQRLDWCFGGHGKRQGAWENQREIPMVADELKVEDRNQMDRGQASARSSIAPNATMPIHRRSSRSSRARRRRSAPGSARRLRSPSPSERSGSDWPNRKGSADARVAKGSRSRPEPQPSRLPGEATSRLDCRAVRRWGGGRPVADDRGGRPIRRRRLLRPARPHADQP